jgi:hypothetical protein
MCSMLATDPQQADATKLLQTRNHAGSIVARMWRLGLLLALVGGCVAVGPTPYQSLRPANALEMSGGYSEHRLDEATYQVSFAGNGYTDRGAVLAMLHRRCAEVTVAAGFRFFLVVDKSHHATDIDTQFAVYTRHDETVTIKMLREADARPPAAFDAGEVLRYATRAP